MVSVEEAMAALQVVMEPLVYLHSPVRSRGMAKVDNTRDLSRILSSLRRAAVSAYKVTTLHLTRSLANSTS